MSEGRHIPPPPTHTHHHHHQARGERFWQELDLVATNTLCLSAANAALVYLVAPTRAAPAPARFEWQNALARLPNNVFEG